LGIFSEEQRSYGNLNPDLLRMKGVLMVTETVRVVLGVAMASRTCSWSRTPSNIMIYVEDSLLSKLRVLFAVSVILEHDCGVGSTDRNLIDIHWHPWGLGNTENLGLDGKASFEPSVHTVQINV
jgi:hypothetical protein